jgi:hypothetical protein
MSQGTFDGFGDDYERRKERARKSQAEQSRKGRDIGPLPPVADPERKDNCRRDLRAYLETYHAAKFGIAWSDDHLEAIRLLEATLLEGGLYALAMPRANGKTTLCIGATEWAACYGHRRYIVPIGATAAHAEAMLETIKTDFESNELLAADFPEICYPVSRLEGINNRTAGQMLGGVRTRIRWTGKRIVLPTVELPKTESTMTIRDAVSGGYVASSGVIIQTAGLLGAMRGMQYSTPDGITHRPDCAIPDDPQTDESARRPAQTATRLRILTKAVLGLAGPNKRIAAMCPCTVIQRGDMADQLLNREINPEWRGQKTALLRSMPSNLDLWRQYREKRQDSLREFEDIRGATEYYRENQSAMDAGAVASWPERKQPEQISAIQYAMDIWAKDESAFWAEYQNAPLEEDEGDIETLRAAALLERFNGLKRGILPNWATRLTAFIDIQQDCLPWAVVAWGPDFTGAVVDYGAWPDQPERYWTLRGLSVTLRDVTRESTVEEALRVGLGTLTDKLLSRDFAIDDKPGESMRIDWLGIDANWQEHAAMVYAAAKRTTKIQAFNGRFVGAASLPMDQWKKEHGIKVGHFWRRFRGGDKPRLEVDTNYWKSLVAKRCQVAATDAGDWPLGAISWFGDRPEMHELWADQLSAEYGVRVSGRGRRVDEWKNRPGRDNHYFDCLVGAAVGNSLSGAILSGQAEPKKREKKSLKELQNERRRKGG